MSRDHRTVREAAFGAATDFNQQMYEALRSAPWWMISIAFHVFVVVLSTLFQGEAVALETHAALLSEVISAEKPVEAEPTEAPEAVESLMTSDLFVEEPVIRDAPISDHEETANDIDAREAAPGDGTSTGVWEGPSSNSLIGVLRLAVSLPPTA